MTHFALPSYSVHTLLGPVNRLVYFFTVETGASLASGELPKNQDRFKLNRNNIPITGIVGKSARKAHMNKQAVYCHLFLKHKKILIQTLLPTLLFFATLWLVDLGFAFSCSTCLSVSFLFTIEGVCGRFSFGFDRFLMSP